MKKLCFVILGALAALALCGCAQKSTGGWQVWSTYNTTKVIQQTSRNDSYQKADARLSVQMMKNEYENAQLIITANREIAYTLTPGTLQNEAGDVFPQENIQIYHQKYQTIALNYNGDKAFQPGDSIPDMLLPLDIAAKYGENKVAANTNQGITVEFYSQNVAAGIYTGTFILELEGETAQIPVQVEVWDICYEGRREFQSCFVLYRDEIFTGEFCNTDEMVDAYVNMLLEHKVNAMVAESFYTPESLAQEAVRLLDHPNCNSLPFPSIFYVGYQTYADGAVTEDAQLAVDYIKAMAKASTPEKPCIRYAYFYLGGFDEADVVEGRWDASEDFLRDGGEYQQTLRLAVEQLQAEGWFAGLEPAFAAQMEADILQIPAVFTNVNFVEDWVGQLNAAFCPYISVFHDTATLNRYQDAAEARSNGQLWAYTCCGPVDPFPTFHIDDGTLDMRVCGWMEKAFGITGYLYYKVNNYAYLTHVPVDSYIDMYATPARYDKVNGDGFLFYPGRYYGSSAPFATVRLAAYRDSMDDYDMLCIYEKLLYAYAQQQGIEDFDFSLYVEDLYRSLFQGLVARQDAGLLYAAREELARRILALQTEGTLLYDPLNATRVQLTDFSGGEQAVLIRSEYKDKGQQIGTKTKMFRPQHSVAVSSMAGAKALSFTYENTGSQDIVLRLELVTADQQQLTLDTSYCGAGKTRQVRVLLPENLSIDLADVTQILLTFDNITEDQDGQLTLLPDRSFLLHDIFITT